MQLTALNGNLRNIGVGEIAVPPRHSLERRRIELGADKPTLLKTNELALRMTHVDAIHSAVDEAHITHSRLRETRPRKLAFAKLNARERDAIKICARHIAAMDDRVDKSRAGKWGGHQRCALDAPVRHLQHIVELVMQLAGQHHAFANLAVQ